MPLKETSANKAARPSRKSKLLTDSKENADSRSKPAASTPRSRKRRAPGENEDDNDGNVSDVPSVKEDDCFNIEYDCDEVRDKIREYLENKKVKATDFQKKLHVPPAVYKSFMNQPKGTGNGLKNKTYAAAHQFLTQQESSGQDPKSPAPKKQKTDSKDEKSKNKDNDVINADDLPKLDGESDDSMQIYDTCNDVRTKIDAHLRKHKLTKAAFAKEISKFQAPGESVVTPTQLTGIQRKNGPLAGNSSKAFYASHVYFEKLRTKEGKDKSKKRKEMEELHGDKGVFTDRAVETMHFTMSANDRVYIDKYGKLRDSAGTW